MAKPTPSAPANASGKITAAKSVAGASASATSAPRTMRRVFITELSAFSAFSYQLFSFSAISSPESGTWNGEVSAGPVAVTVTFNPVCRGRAEKLTR
jgi:hypothetical protein